MTALFEITVEPPLFPEWELPLKGGYFFQNVRTGDIYEVLSANPSDDGSQVLTCVTLGDS